MWAPGHQAMFAGIPFNWAPDGMVVSVGLPERPERPERKNRRKSEKAWDFMGFNH